MDWTCPTAIVVGNENRYLFSYFSILTTLLERSLWLLSYMVLWYNSDRAFASGMTSIFVIELCFDL